MLGLWGSRTIRLTDGDFWKGFFNLGTHSGQTVNSDVALQLDAFWACVKLMSEVAGSLPCMIHNVEDQTVAREHELYELLHHQPNADDTAVEFWEGVIRSMIMDGNAYAEKEVNRNGKVTALTPIPASTVEVYRNNSGERTYKVKKEGKVREVSEDRMFHVRNMKMPGMDIGLSTIGYARHTLGSSTAAEKTSGKMFSNGLQSAGFLTVDKILQPEQRAQIGKILESYAGSDRAGKIAVFEAGFNYHQLTMTPEDAQMLDTRRFSVEQICRWFGIPPIMIGHASQGQTMWGSGVEQIILQFTKTALRPMLKRIEAAIRRDLLSRADRQRIKVEFNMEGLLRGDSAARAAFYSTMVQNGIMDRNECRVLENRPTRPGADKLTAQTNLAPLDKLGEESGAGQLANGISALIAQEVEKALGSAPKE